MNTECNENTLQTKKNEMPNEDGQLLTTNETSKQSNRKGGQDMRKERNKYKSVFIPEDELRRKYLDQKMKISEIVKYYKVDRSTIYDRINKYNIPLRGHGSISKEKLIELYIEKDLTAKQISQLVDISPHSIRRKLRNFGIIKVPKDLRLEGQKFNRLTVIKQVVS